MIDSHCHFDFSEFDQDRSEILAECNTLGVSHIVMPGVSPEQWPKLEKLSEDFSALYFALGVHPWWLSKLSFSAEALYEQLVSHPLSSHSKCVAVGECGLDGLIDFSLAQQYAFLDAHIAAANFLSLPLIFHCRKDQSQLLQALKNNSLDCGGVLHAFSGSQEQGEAYIRHGLYLGIGGTISYERAKKTRGAVAALPFDALLVETDAPDMPLAGSQGQRNSPTQLPKVVRYLAELKAVDEKTIIEKTRSNTLNLFTRLPC